MGTKGPLVAGWDESISELPDPAKPFVTYKVGTAEVTAIYDGIWEKAHDPAFIINASVDDVKAAMTELDEAG